MSKNKTYSVNYKLADGTYGEQWDISKEELVAKIARWIADDDVVSFKVNEVGIIESCFIHEHNRYARLIEEEYNKGMEEILTDRIESETLWSRLKTGEIFNMYCLFIDKGYYYNYDREYFYDYSKELQELKQ